MLNLRTLVLATAKFGSKIQSLKACRQLRFSSTSYPTSVFRTVHSSEVKHQGPVAKPKEEEKPVLVNAIRDVDGSMITIGTSTGEQHQYPSLWLRDNCQCPKCFNTVMQSRTLDWKYFDVNIKPTHIMAEDNQLKLVWSDDHESDYDFNWLLERSFAENVRKDWLKQHYPMMRISWDTANFNKILNKYNFHDVLNSETTLLDLLESVATYGIAVIDNAPPQEDQLRKIANKVGFIKRTHYGEEYMVKHQPDTNNLAYTPGNLQMHTDMPYYHHKPGINMLHCLVQTEAIGGDNQVTDALHITKKLKEEKPEVYRVLTETPVDWYDIGQEGGYTFHSLYRSPVILTDSNGEFLRIDYSQQQRDTHFTVPLDQVIPWYEAHAAFTEEIYNPENTVYFKLKDGEILMFDNVRLLHGRKGYDDKPNNTRHLVGSYLDWDLAYSRIRVLRKKLRGHTLSNQP
ncbi:gamma-butyrobetaine dioxygenase-like [Zootermopsis nevadensis]|uniref:Gamma-butyrobetaine dioxygenase n=1 Tax=Zootermopsis nevadensis TaxID=136037 RepID=A0A067QYH6_ZOONE|nr:gamma-butyrobetaine dioxygenase-like [Zootermopsis nevadensis]KDR15510.1 Gamma-butyrobetaine dioxygenase [Zootermopsis nevadensis]